MPTSSRTGSGKAIDSDCETAPTARARSGRFQRVIGRSFNVAEPDSHFAVPSSARMSVDFPEPLGPITE